MAAFLASRGIDRDVPGVGPGRPPLRVLFVGFTPAERGELARDGLVASFSQSGPAAGLAMAGFRPDVVVVDAAIGRIESTQTAVAARSVGALPIAYGGGFAVGGEFHGFVATPAELDAILGAVAGSGGGV